MNFLRLPIKSRERNEQWGMDFLHQWKPRSLFTWTMGRFPKSGFSTYVRTWSWHRSANLYLLSTSKPLCFCQSYTSERDLWRNLYCWVFPRPAYILNLLSVHLRALYKNMSDIPWMHFSGQKSELFSQPQEPYLLSHVQSLLSIVRVLVKCSVSQPFRHFLSTK